MRWVITFLLVWEAPYNKTLGQSQRKSEIMILKVMTASNVMRKGSASDGLGVTICTSPLRMDTIQGV